MSLTKCLNCNRRISDMTTDCEHCGYTGLSADPEKIKELKRRIYREKRYRLTMRSYIALTVFTAGMIWFWVQSDGFGGPPGIGPMIMLLAGAIGYFVIRTLMVLLKLRNK